MTQLTEAQWKLIHGWTGLSRQVLFQCLAGNVAFDVVLPSNYSVGQVIGMPNVPGMLLVLRICKGCLGLTAEQQAALLAEGIGFDVPDHPFNPNAGLGDPPLIFNIGNRALALV